MALQPKASYNGVLNKTFVCKCYEPGGHAVDQSSYLRMTRQDSKDESPEQHGYVPGRCLLLHAGVWSLTLQRRRDTVRQGKLGSNGREAQ